MFKHIVFLLSCYIPIVSTTLKAWEINENVQNKALYGDMMLTPLQLLRYGDEGKPPVRGVYRKESSVNRWKDNIVPYSLSPQYTERQKEVLRRSMRGLEAVACFKFVERTSQQDYLFIAPMDGCYSYVGKIGGRQIMSLAVDCLADYIIWHEVMHAIGFEHEHQRPDRDSFIRVEYSNVQPGQMVNFEKISVHEVDYPDAYDYKSIMHYDGMAFGRKERGRRLATMIPLKKGVTLNDNTALSPVDILKLRRLGKCDVNSKAGNSASSSSVAGVTRCVDSVQNCATMLQKGMCKMAFYRPTMERQCSRTCGLCNRRATEEIVGEDEGADSESTVETTVEGETPDVTEHPDEVPRTNGTCQDMKVNCSKYKDQCGVKEYDEMMRLLCPATCGLCPAPGEAVETCVDADPNCARFAQNGFCTDKFYASVRGLRCAKTCKLC